MIKELSDSSENSATVLRRIDFMEAQLITYPAVASEIVSNYLLSNHQSCKVSSIAYESNAGQEMSLIFHANLRDEGGQIFSVCGNLYVTKVCLA